MPCLVTYFVPLSIFLIEPITLLYICWSENLLDFVLFAWQNYRKMPFIYEKVRYFTVAGKVLFFFYSTLPSWLAVKDFLRVISPNFTVAGKVLFLFYRTLPSWLAVNDFFTFFARKHFFAFLKNPNFSILVFLID